MHEQLRTMLPLKFSSAGNAIMLPTRSRAARKQALADPGRIEAYHVFLSNILALALLVREISVDR